MTSRFCPHCGISLSDNARFCKGCGISLGRTQQTQTGETIPRVVADSAVAPEATPRAPHREPGPVFEVRTMPTPPLQPLWMPPAEADVVAVGPQFAPAVATAGWTSGFLALCGIAALLLGALVGFLVVHLVLAR